ncbi:unnamed protein product [Rhizoctonia solani]|uniref:Protein kinase domain-containing protein n=1 Tax=Rhizoctonia solani TaxID=456999 RepID=A0A8H3E298_9AGAM|nr:unnamed protein product [Rhizoctonia solani]
MVVHEGHTQTVTSVEFSPDGKSIASGSYDNTVRMWDAHHPSPIGEALGGHSQIIHSVSYSPLGDLIASGSGDNTIRLWDTNTVQQSGVPLEGDKSFLSVAFSPDARLIASGSGGVSGPTAYAVQLWDVQKREATSRPFQAHTGSVKSVSFFPGGTRLVSGSYDKTIRVWDVERGETIVGPLEGHTDSVCSTAVSPDGAQIVSCSWDGTIRFRDARNGGLIGEPYTGHTGIVSSVAFSPRGTYVASGGYDKTVCLWDIRTGRQVNQPFKEHTNIVTSVAFSPCGQYIASGSHDCKVIIRKVLDYASDSDDVEPRIVTKQMSTQEIFECVTRAGCADLSSQMDSRQETAMVASRGGFADTWKGKLHSGAIVAIKAWQTDALERRDQQTLERAAHELFLWSKMDNPNVHRLQGVILFRDQYLGMVSEWMDNGNLHQYLRKYPSADRYQLIHAPLQYRMFLSSLNERPAVDDSIKIHGDLKAINVLVSHGGVAQISGFGHSILSEASSGPVFSVSSNAHPETARWAAPELLNEQTQNKTTESDVYAFGMTMLEIFTGTFPFPERKSDVDVISAVLGGAVPARPRQLGEDEKSSLMWHLMSLCWNRDPSARQSSDQVANASVASGSRDKTVQIWGANDSSPIGKPLRGHSYSIYSVSYSPLGNLIASGSWDSTIRLWDAKTGQQLGAPLKGNYLFHSVAFSPDAKLIASGCSGFSTDPAGYALQLWDVHRRKAASNPFKGHTNPVWSTSFSPDGTRLVSGSSDKTIRVWDVEREVTIVGPLKGHTYGVRSVALSPDGAQIVSGSCDGTIRLWDARNGGMIGEPSKGHTDWVQSVTFSPRGTYVASGGTDKTVRLWDIRTSRQVDQFQEHANGVASVAFSPCGQYVVSGSWDCQVVIRKVLGGDSYSNDHSMPTTVTNQMTTQDIFECLQHAGCVDLSSQMDSRQETAMIMSGGGFGDIWKGKLHNGTNIAIKAWRTNVLEQCDYKTLKRAARELFLWSKMDHPHIHRLQGMILFRDHYLGMVSEWMDNGNLHEYLRKRPDANLYHLCTHVASGLEYMHSRNTVHGDLKAANVLVSSDGVARLSDFDYSIMSEVSSLVFSESSNTRAGSIRWAAPEILLSEVPIRTTESDVYALGMIRVLDQSAGSDRSQSSPCSRLFVIPAEFLKIGGTWRGEGHTQTVTSVEFSPDGKSIASGSYDNTVRMWDAHRPSPIGEALGGHSQIIHSVSYSPLGNLIASGSGDNTIRLWDTNTVQQSGVPLEGDKSFLSVAFSPDARLIASGSGGVSGPTAYAVQLWDVQKREATSRPFQGHAGSVKSISFFPGGTRLVSGSYDKTIRVWDVERGETIIGPLEGHTDSVCSTTFSPDGAQIVSCSWDGTIRFWDARNGGPIGEPYTGHTGIVNSFVCGIFELAVK